MRLRIPTHFLYLCPTKHKILFVKCTLYSFVLWTLAFNKMYAWMDFLVWIIILWKSSTCNTFMFWITYYRRFISIKCLPFIPHPRYFKLNYYTIHKAQSNVNLFSWTTLYICFTSYFINAFISCPIIIQKQ